MENNITNKELFYHYAESLGIKINDAQRLMVLALASREESLPQADVIKSVCDVCNSTTDKPTYKLCDKHYSEYENFKQTVSGSLLSAEEMATIRLEKERGKNIELWIDGEQTEYWKEIYCMGVNDERIRAVNDR